MSGETAQRAHQLAAKITAARSRGDIAEANRLVQLFNQQLLGRVTLPNQLGSSDDRNFLRPSKASINNNYNQRGHIPTLAESIQKDVKSEPGSRSAQGASAPSTSVSDSQIPVPKPAKAGSLAEAIVADQMQNPPTPDLESQLQSVVTTAESDDPFSYLTTESSRLPKPALPSIDSLISEYHPGVQSLLKQSLKDFSIELQIPDQVLAPNLITEFEKLWRKKQSEESLLLKLPIHIQQRSVLLRYQDELLGKLS